MRPNRSCAAEWWSDTYLIIPQTQSLACLPFRQNFINKKRFCWINLQHPLSSDCFCCLARGTKTTLFRFHPLLLELESTKVRRVKWLQTTAKLCGWPNIRWHRWRGCSGNLAAQKGMRSLSLIILCGMRWGSGKWFWICSHNLKIAWNVMPWWNRMPGRANCAHSQILNIEFRRQGRLLVYKAAPQNHLSTTVHWMFGGRGIGCLCYLCYGVKMKCRWDGTGG